MPVISSNFETITCFEHESHWWDFGKISLPFSVDHYSKRNSGSIIISYSEWSFNNLPFQCQMAVTFSYSSEILEATNEYKVRQLWVYKKKRQDSMFNKQTKICTLLQSYLRFVIILYGLPQKRVEFTVLHEYEGWPTRRLGSRQKMWKMADWYTEEEERNGTKEEQREGEDRQRREKVKPLFLGYRSQ